MRSINVVTAFNPKNAGMYTVDLAAAQFLQESGFQVKLVRIQSKRIWMKSRFGRQRFDLLRSLDELLDTDILAYWGDFTTNLLYGLNDFSRRDQAFGFSKSQEAAFDRWMELFLPARETRHTRIYSVGQNFHSINACLMTLSETLRDEILSRYRYGFDAFLPRDDESMKSLQGIGIGQVQGQLVQGLDPAMLLDHRALYPSLKAVRSNNTFAYLFGRSGFTCVPELIKKIESRTKCRGVDLLHWHKLASWKADRQMRQMLESITAAKFVVTDTYHCAVNAIGLGKMVLGLGIDQQEQSMTVSEPKKRILFRMMGLSEDYLSFTHQKLSAEEQEQITAATLNLANRDQDAIETVNNLKAEFRDNLLRTLRGR